MSQKYGLDEIKVMIKLVHARVSKEHVKMVLQLAQAGVNEDNIDDFYDAFASDVNPSVVHSPPSSLPRSDTTVTDFESPPSSQVYPSISDNETNSRPLEIDSPPYTDEDPWAGLPKDPNYTPKTTSNSSKQNHNINHDSIVSTIPTQNTHKTSTTSEKRTRDRFVFRSIHQDILNDAFFQNPYPENDEKEILVDKCNHALEGYKCRPLRENEKMTILNITNWFNNRRKEKKRKFTKESTSLAITPAPFVSSAHHHHHHYQEETTNRVKEEVISEQEDDY